MPKITYDPEIRKSESGSRIYGAWKRLRKHPYNPIFEEFQNFYKWAISEGYVIGDKLMRRDESLPYAPGNCYWKSPKDEDIPEEISAAWALEWCEKWDETVSKLRKHFGLPPLKGGSS